jgi:hypothetical protein
MADHVEDRVRTIVARMLRLPPDNIRPESMLLMGQVGPAKMRAIAHYVENAYDVILPENAAEGWTTVADVVISAERAIAAEQLRVAGRAA